jgi:hypothetical protein
MLLQQTETFTSGELQVECVIESLATGGLCRGRGESPPTWQGQFGANGWPTDHPHGRPVTPLGLHHFQALDHSL